MTLITCVIFSLCTADCSVALQDPNCEECGFDSNNMPICAVCKSGYKPQDGKCEKEGMCSEFSISEVLVILSSLLSPPPPLSLSLALIHCDHMY